MSERLGATKAEWDHFSLVLGLTQDLLPVVADQNATISAQSKMKSLGKTPSIYNRQGQVAGIPRWTQKKSTAAEITAWREVPELGVCVQTRHVRALDIDIDNNDIIAKIVYDEIHNALEQALPARRRSNSSKFLLAFTLEGEYAKRTIQTDHGIIEFLATGQQFIAAGTHPSGVPYTWEGGLPDDIPVLDGATFERLWSRLTECFASDGTSDVAVPTIRHTKLAEAAQNDSTALSLFDLGLVLSAERDGRLHITCPFSAEHTAGSDDSATTYFPSNTGGYARGHFSCLHAHCAERTDGEFLTALGLSAGNLDDFDIVPDSGTDVPNSGTTLKYAFEPWESAINAPPPTFHVQGVLPEAEVVVVYGAPSSGKTFLTLDLACAVARGIPWRDRKVKQGAVAYIAAEDAHGVAMRVRAYTQANEIAPGTMPLALLSAAPSFMSGEDVKAVLAGIRAYGDVRLIFVDTWSRVIAGFDENSAADVTKAVAYCSALARATHATVVLIHHSGKDASKGARGSTVLLGACDAEIEVTRFEQEREAQVTKMKNYSDGDRFGFKLRVVPVCHDAEGDVISSCVLEHTEARAKTERARHEPKGAVEKLVLTVLNELGIGGAVMTSELAAAAKERMPYDTSEGKRDKRREHIMRALLSLQERGAVKIEGDKVTLAGEE